MAKLEDLIAERVTLDRQISELRSAERARALSDIRGIMRTHGVTVADLAPAQARKIPTAKGSQVPAKYSDGNGNSWSGRGLKPKWLTAALAQGQALESFLLR